MSLNKILKNALKLKNIDNLPKDMTMQSTPEWDSMAHMELIYSMEKNYDITFTAEEILKMTSIAGIYEVLNLHGISVNEN